MRVPGEASEKADAICGPGESHTGHQPHPLYHPKLLGLPSQCHVCHCQLGQLPCQARGGTRQVGMYIKQDQ